jgi:two-component system, NtrC family, sensor kinase
MIRIFPVLFCVALFMAINSLLVAGNRETDSLIHLIEHTSIPDNRAKYDMMCTIAQNSDDASMIIHYSSQAIQLAEDLGISLAAPTAMKGIGYLNSGKLTLALECFLKSASYYKTEGNNIGLASVYTYISETYNMQENHRNEVFYLKNAISIFRKENDSVNLASALHNLGYANYSMKQYDTALTLFNTTADIYQKLGYKQQYAYCIGNMGLVYSKTMKLDKAEKYLLSAIGILKTLHDEYAVTEYLIEYSSVLQHKGNIRSALVYARKGYSYARNNDFMEFERDASLRLAQLFIASGKYDSACFYQSHFISLSDSIKNYTNVQKMADLRTEFEVAKKQSEVDVLEKNRTIQQIVIISLGLILLLTIWLMVLYYSSFRKLRRLNDILDERRLLLERQSAELKELNRIKDKFFSLISHDLRSPISAIGGISHLIKESVEQNNPALLTEITNYIDQTVFSLTGLLENLLNWAQTQQGKIFYAEEKLDMKEIILEVMTLFSTVAILKNIRLNLKLKPGLSITGDRNSMMTIIRNLITNALKFTQNGGEVIVTTYATTDNHAIIEVSDNGVGIEHERFATLFEFKEDKSTYGTEREKGVGLGLNLVNEFVKLNRGTIEVDSTVGKGTKFVLQFNLSLGD